MRVHLHEHTVQAYRHVCVHAQGARLAALNQVATPAACPELLCRIKIMLYCVGWQWPAPVVVRLQPEMHALLFRVTHPFDQSGTCSMATWLLFDNACPMKCKDKWAPQRKAELEGVCCWLINVP